MFIRIVKMTFQPDKVEEFLGNFDANKQRIRDFQGCQRLDLLRDKEDSSTFFTYSWWDSEESLEAYRKSELFRGVWAKTKTLFADKPEAWSVDRLEHLP